MDSLRLPPLNFDALPTTRRFLPFELPPISLPTQPLPQRPSTHLQSPCNRQFSASVQYITHATNTSFNATQSTHSNTTTANNPLQKPLPSLSPLLNETAHVLMPPRLSSPIASYRQSTPQSTPTTTPSPTSSTSSTPPIPTYPTPTYRNTSNILSPHSSYSSTLPPSIPVSLSPSINDQQHLQPRIKPLSQSRQTVPRQAVQIENELPPGMPLAPVKKAIQTPKGIREVYTCPFPSCTRISSEHSNMKAHMRLHTGERPYVCRVPSCRKSFRWKSSLTYHERALHSNSRPYQCIPCRKSFVEKRKLRLHLQLCPAARAAQSDVLRYSAASLKVSSGRATKWIIMRSIQIIQIIKIMLLFFYNYLFALCFVLKRVPDNRPHWKTRVVLDWKLNFREIRGYYSCWSSPVSKKRNNQLLRIWQITFLAHNRNISDYLAAHLTALNVECLEKELDDTQLLKVIKVPLFQAARDYKETSSPH